MPHPQLGPVDAKTLHQLKAKGVVDPLIDMRLAYMDKNQLLTHYIGPAAGRSTKSKAKEEPWLKPDGRCYPSMLPTQAGGRWSTTDPPLATFPPAYRGIVVPDPTDYWVVWDLDAIEAKISAAECDDTEDLQAFARHDDIHTLTFCRMFNKPLPPDLRDPHTAAVNAAWRESLGWGGKDDRRRHCAKTMRYGLLYSLDWKGVYEIKDVEKLGLSREDLGRQARQYLAAKPKLVARRRFVGEEGWRLHKGTTHFGRSRPLEGDYRDVMKKAWSMRISGTVSDIMNATLIDVDARWPESTLAYQAHDSATIAFPLGVNPWPELRQIVERDVTIRGHVITCTANFYIIPPGGHVHGERCKLSKCDYATPEEWGGGTTWRTEPCASLLGVGVGR